jgi:glucosamine 6-phosphate synthetase-like amidotransferase/phosphosugar isomerase protein
MIKKLFTAAALFGLSSLPEKKEVKCCGIVGMVMKTPITKEQQAKMDQKHYRFSLEEFLCEGIELLKNRGYDSAGVYTLAPNAVNGSRLVKYAEHGTKQAGCITKVID